ncbi:hypothetical protein NXS19_012049 [Fusarium pseudograminearum]|nr:hypothetical protein NXS19_012049 [Fusarium pseudograminearum]
MASVKSILFGLFASTALALPSVPMFTKRQLRYHELSKRQNDAAAAAGLDDPSILQFALTLEHLESAFYRESFLTISDAEFAPIGLEGQTLDDVKAIGKTEAAHVVLLQSALTAAGFAPVQECKYDFKGATADPAAMVATAAILESVGVSAYLGAAPLLTSPAILGVAGSILTVEARHQTAIRVFSKAIAVPQPLDTPLVLAPSSLSLRHSSLSALRDPTFWSKHSQLWTWLQARQLKPQPSDPRSSLLPQLQRVLPTAASQPEVCLLAEPSSHPSLKERDVRFPKALQVLSMLP